MESTIALFRHFYQNLPPLFPQEVKIKMKHALHYFESGPPVTLESIEDTMIDFGYQAWPWNRAYQEFFAASEEQMGEHFLLPKLTPELQHRYAELQLYGGNLRDLHSGRPAHFFSHQERTDLSAALVEIRNELRALTNHAVVSINQKRYLARVADFTSILAGIQNSLNQLKEIADAEFHHPSLADEIRAHTRSFEYGLCLLGPEKSPEAADQALEFFRGRRHELDRFKGAHTTLQVDFYS